MARAAEFKDQKLKKFLSGITKKFEGVKKGDLDYAKRISPIVFADVISHFEKEQGPTGKWAEWSEPYKERMEKIGKGGNKILQDSGNLRQSFFPFNFRRSSKGILWFNPAKTKGGFPYAPHHDETAQTTRPYMWLSKKALNLISKKTLKSIVKRI